MNKLARGYVHTFRGKCTILLTTTVLQPAIPCLPILGSRLNVSNAPNDRSYCSCAWNEP